MGLKAASVAVITGAIVVAAGAGNPTSFEPSSVDRRTCELGRDIAADYGVADTFRRSQERIAQLDNRYGEAASPTIAAASASWWTSITSADPNLDLVFLSMNEFRDACGAEGL